MKRFFQIAAAFVAVVLFVLAPIACQQAEKPADTTETAKPAGPADGKRLMAATPKAQQAVEETGEALDDAGEAVDDLVEEGTAAAGEALDEGADAVKDATKDH